MKKEIINISLTSIATLALLAFGSTAQALDVNISKSMPYLDVKHEGETIRIQRVQDQENHLTGGFAKTSRTCPPFCVQPMNVTPEVATVGELEVLQFIKERVKTGSGVLIDARTPSWHAKGTIPSSVNIPFTTFALKQDDKRLISAMKKLGVKPRVGGPVGGIAGYWTDLKVMAGIEKKPHPYWDYATAKEILLWCNGMWCGQSPRAIYGLLKHGYPADKIKYYRGGMQTWRILGLTVVTPGGAE